MDTPTTGGNRLHLLPKTSTTENHQCTSFVFTKVPYHRIDESFKSAVFPFTIFVTDQAKSRSHLLRSRI